MTEFLPVSRSGHLAIAHLLGLSSLPPDLKLPFDVLLHAATLVAISIAFARDLFGISATFGPDVYQDCVHVNDDHRPIQAPYVAGALETLMASDAGTTQVS